LLHQLNSEKCIHPTLFSLFVLECVKQEEK
jgi:hypothetical protein